MADHGYGSVDEVGFLAFEVELGEAPFVAHAIKKAPGLKASVLEVHYWTLLSVLVALRAGVTSQEEGPGALDVPFDGSQRSLRNVLLLHVQGADAKKAEAATTVFAGLLSGKSGLAQTRLTLEREVEFGRAQVSLARSAPYAALIKLLGIEAYIDAVDEATEALAAALGKVPGSSALVARGERRRVALTACRSAFQSVHASLVAARPHADEALGAVIDAWIAALDAIPRG